jgi:phenylacetate-CoA ligase
LLRYQTGDVIRLLDVDWVIDMARCHGLRLAPDLPSTLLALRGRERETLPNRTHVAFYKDALYANHQTARHLTGAFRIAFEDDRCRLYVQLNRSAANVSEQVRAALLKALPGAAQPDELVLCAYEEFPFGMGLDYERKFAYVAPQGRERHGR